MGYLRRKARDSYKTSAELDKTLAEASQFYSELRRRVAEEDGLDPDEAAINPELVKLKERYGDELPGEIYGLTAQQILAEMGEPGKNEGGPADDPDEAEPTKQPGRKVLAPRTKSDQTVIPTPSARPTPKSRSRPVRKATRGSKVTAPSGGKQPTTGSPGRLVTLELPEGLLASIDEHIEEGEYSSTDDFVKEAVRDKLRSLRM